jgi:hypothetical protein
MTPPYLVLDKGGVKDQGSDLAAPQRVDHVLLILQVEESTSREGVQG